MPSARDHRRGVESVFLRQHDGAPVGPVTATALELLFDARIVDPSTPVSEDGSHFSPLGEHPALLARLETAKARASSGDDPWPEVVLVQPEAPVDLEAHRSAARWVIDVALARLTGVLRTPELAFGFRDGKLVEAVAEDERFLDWLAESGRVAPAMLAAASENPGGDLAAALVGSGAIAPDAYMEAMGAWALEGLGSAFLLEDPSEVSFDEGPVEPPALPLGFSPLPVVGDALRALPSAQLDAFFDGRDGCPVIPSQVQGLDMDALKLRPRELRAMRQINGARTVGEILAEGGEDGQRALALGVLTGLLVLGEDPQAARARQQAAEDARRLAEAEAVLAELEAKPLHEVLGVSERASEADVRARYAELARKHHPDKLGAGASKALQSVAAAITSRLNEAFEAHSEPEVELSPEQRSAESQTCAKKAEVLLRMRKYEAALELVERANELTPGQPPLLVQLAWVRFQLAHRGEQSEAAARSARDVIKKALGQDPSLVEGHLRYGQVSKALGDEESALKAFRRVLSLDRKHPEAIREVRLANLRAEKAKKRRWI